MKKSIHPIIIILITFILLSLIILPPTLRAFYPKVEKSKGTNQDQITLVVCTKDSKVEQVRAISQTRYINNKIVENRMTFSKLEVSKTMPTTERQVTAEADSITEELNFLQHIPTIKTIINEKEIVITITADTIKKNPDNTQLASYFDKNINTQKIGYANRKYNCEVTTN